MIYAYIINFASYIVWAVIPFRHYKKTYFFYFLSMAVLDPGSIVLMKMFNIPVIDTLTAASLLMAISIFEISKIKKYFHFNLLLFLSTIVLIASFSNISRYIIIFFHLFIFFIFLKRNMMNIYERYEFNLFLFMLLFYEVSIILKFVIRVADLNTGWAYFFITSAFQILIGIFFIFYNEKNSPELSLKFMKVD